MAAHGRHRTFASCKDRGDSVGCSSSTTPKPAAAIPALPASPKPPGSAARGFHAIGELKDAGWITVKSTKAEAPIRTNLQVRRQVGEVRGTP